ncbi:pleckstrin domain-containing protein [Heterostelium album PN500]|uniref:Pleckstrin domain-containing protein n=1 Tax=Heterostelium pallidum (strain ATCC 26659 / Pp 5 / PN500) TaxID=670386 RepID=D3B989_HETP5|nr:pleckstrin domain-containing protein [Heterostelium album PN500]EFA82128.1 pleckstrin domain-containing protein [Heterostelium album PN500]|eukprot:XP_020434245.1 pleckstrin domain-containing protein [Heterostelium album PN500]
MCELKENSNKATHINLSLIRSIQDKEQLLNYATNLDERMESLLGALSIAYLQRKKHIISLKCESTRKEISKEIWNTERYYNAQLATVIELFLRPMVQLEKDNDQNYGITETDIHSIFSHIESIYNLSSLLFDRLDPVVKNWSPSSSIGNIFLDVGPFFKCYKQFSENYTHSIETLNRIRQSTQPIANWLKNKEKDPRCHSLDLSSLLIAPIQRTPRYILLLEALFKATPVDHPDKKRCEAAANLLKSIVQVVNDGIQEDINRKKLIQLQSLIDQHNKYFGPLSVSNLVEPHRKLIREGRLQKKSMRDQSLQTRMVYLLNDYFVTVTPLPAINKIDKIIPLVTASIFCDSESVSPIKSHLFICENTNVRSQWMLDLQSTTSILVDSNPQFKVQRDQWSIEHNDGIWKAVTNIPISTPDQIKNVSKSIESNTYLHEPVVKTHSYAINNKHQQHQQHIFLSHSNDSNNNINNNESDNNRYSKSMEDKEWVMGVRLNKQQSSSSFLVRSLPNNLEATDSEESPELLVFKNNHNNNSNGNGNGDNSLQFNRSRRRGGGILNEVDKQAILREE